MARKHAFSLLELLLVVAAIAIFLALLIPVSSSMRRSALEARSTNNLRQIGAALTIYISDTRE